jgi:hypothetical protein
VTTAESRSHSRRFELSYELSMIRLRFVYDEKVMNIPSARDDADTIVVYTSKSYSQIVRLGGSGDWAVDPSHVRRCKWLVCIQNDRRDLSEFDPAAPHNSAFLLAKIAGVEPVEVPTGKPRRWRITISEAAEISYLAMWDGKRSSTRYTKLAALGIDPNQMFTPVAHGVTSPAAEQPRLSVARVLADAKASIGATLGIDPAAVEIVLRA